MQLNQHMVSQHFKDKLFADVIEKDWQFLCPIENCDFQNKSKYIWARHYGSAHGMFEKYIKEYLDGNKVSKIDKPEVDKSDETQARQESKGFDEKLDDSVNSVQTEEKAGEFKCEYCSSEFTHEDQLKKHLGEEHFGIAPFT